MKMERINLVQRSLMVKHQLQKHGDVHLILPLPPDDVLYGNMTIQENVRETWKNFELQTPGVCSWRVTPPSMELRKFSKEIKFFLLFILFFMKEYVENMKE